MASSRRFTVSYAPRALHAARSGRGRVNAAKRCSPDSPTFGLVRRGAPPWLLAWLLESLLLTDDVRDLGFVKPQMQPVGPTPRL